MNLSELKVKAALMVLEAGSAECMESILRSSTHYDVMVTLIAVVGRDEANAAVQLVVGK